MIKILIVERDLETSKVLKKIIISNEGVSGDNVFIFNNLDNSLINFIERESIDLIFYDIRFYGVMAYSVVKEVNEKNSNVRFVPYGLPSERDYLKKCTDLAGISFFYKPFKPLEISKILSDAIVFFNEQNKKNEYLENVEVNFENYVNVFEHSFFATLVTGQYTDVREIENNFSYFGIKKYVQGYRVVVCKIDKYKKMLLALDEREKYLFLYKFLEFTKRKLIDMQCKVFYTNFNAINVLIFGQYSQDEIMDIFEEFQIDFNKEFSLLLTVGVGREYSAETDIHVSYKEAMGALKYKYILGANSIILISYVEPNNFVTYRYPYDLENKLIEIAVIGEYEYACRLTEKIIDQLRTYSEFDMNIIPKITLSILFSISRRASEKSLKINESLTSFFSVEKLMQLDNFDDTEIYIKEFLKGFCEYVNGLLKESEDKIYETAKKYAEENYKESISAKKIARICKTTTEQLNKVMLERENENMYEYIITKRMEVAKKMMRETIHSDDVIITKIGYLDKRYFRSEFKRKEGMTTSEYRDKYSLFFKE